MKENKEFIEFVNRLKTLSPIITDEQRIGLLRQGIQEYGLTTEEADNILKTSGLIVGEQENHFDILGISIEDIKNLTESDIVTYIKSVHEELYRASLNAGGRPRSDGRTEEEWRKLLNQARDKLIDPDVRWLHIPSVEKDIQSETKGTQIISDNMVLIPHGEFQMGSDDLGSNKNEIPVQTVYVEEFYIDAFPVTNIDFKLFLDKNPKWKTSILMDGFTMRKYRDSYYLKTWDRNKFPAGKEEHPVTWVSWYAAMAYAQWLGRRLPTEAEWEKAARGGLDGEKFPWGNSIDKSLANYGINLGSTTPIRHYPPNNYGVYDMVGNVAEWCLDNREPDLYQSSQGINHIMDDTIEDIVQRYTNIRKKRIVRGGSWHTAGKDLQISYREDLHPKSTASVTGFRCVKPTNK